MTVDISRMGKPVEALNQGGIAAGEGKAGNSVGRMFEALLDNAADNLKEADQTAFQANTSGPVDLHDVMIAMEKADISLRLLVQVRNKAVDAYQEIMRMQV